MNLPDGMPLWAFILLIVIGAILGLLILYFIIVFIFYKIFARKIKNNNTAINLLMIQRFEIMKQIIGLLKTHNVNVNHEDEYNVYRLERVNDYQQLLKNDRDERVLSFVHSSYNLVSLCEKTEEVLKDPNYTELLIRFNDIEDVYRQKSALYNSDVLGYNYWVNVPVIKIFFRMAKKHPIDLIV